METKHPIPVVRAIIENSKGEILILKRAKTDYGLDKWCLPGGKVDYMNNLMEAIALEVKEETNLNLKEIEIMFYIDSAPKQRGQMHCIEFYFKAKPKNIDNLKINEESSEFKWAKKEEVDEIDFAFDHGKAVERYFKEREDKYKRI